MSWVFSPLLPAGANELAGAAAISVTADSGAYSTTGSAAFLEYGREAVADVGSYSATGVSASLEYGFEVAAAAGSHTATGAAASLEYGREVAADAGSYTTTGTDAALAIGADKELAADPGSYASTGTAASLERGYLITAGDAVAPTWNPADKAASIALSNGNLTATGGGSAGVYASARATVSQTSGVHSFELAVGAFSSNIGIGIGNTSQVLTGDWPGNSADSIAYYGSNGFASVSFTPPGGASQGLATYGAGDVVKVEIDFSGETVTFFKNGVQQGTPFSATALSALIASGPLYPIVYVETSGDSATADFADWGGGGALAGYVVAGTDAALTIEVDRSISADSGSYASAGTDAALEYGREVEAAAGSYAVAGTDAALELGKEVEAGAGSYALAGTAAALVYGREVAAGAGSYVLTGIDAALELAKEVAADAGAYALSGTAASIEYGREVAAGTAAYSVAGTDASLTILADSAVSADSGVYAVVGTDAALEYGYELAADAGAYAVTGTDADLDVVAGKEVNADSGAYAVTGVGVSLEYGREVSAGAGSYIVTGIDAALEVGIVAVEEPVETGHSAGVSVAYRRRWYQYIESRRRRGTWRPGEGTLEEILRGVWEAEEAAQPDTFDLEAARRALEASRAAAKELEATRQREAILEALLASQKALEDRTAAAIAGMEAQRQQREFEAIQEAVMAAALEWERREQEDLEILLLCA